MFGHLFPTAVFQTTNVVAHRKTTVLRGLPFFLRGNPDSFFKSCLVSNTILNRSQKVRKLDFGPLYLPFSNTNQ